jgi:hypothetical protein
MGGRFGPEYAFDDYYRRNHRSTDVSKGGSDVRSARQSLTQDRQHLKKNKVELRKDIRNRAS